MNQDHRQNIGTHPINSDDPETALRARLDAATRRKADADAAYQKARDNLRVFLAHQEQEQTLGDAMSRHVAAHRAAVRRERVGMPNFPIEDNLEAK